MRYLMNIECGNIYPATMGGVQAAVQEAREMYDYDDNTNAVSIWEYYKLIEIDD